MSDHLSAYLTAPGQIELGRVPMPAPGPGEILLRIERALAGGTDRKAFVRGHPMIPMPGRSAIAMPEALRRLNAGEALQYAIDPWASPP